MKEEEKTYHIKKEFNVLKIDLLGAIILSATLIYLFH
jgi:hypothetical protein